jgi:hypothetical protein
MRVTVRPRPNPCENMNHRRRDAPVAHCPQCGGVVNSALTPVACNDAKHSVARRQQAAFCVDCGAALLIAR